MPDTKLPALTALSAPALDDLIYAVDVSDTTDDASGSSKSLRVDALLALGGRLTISNQTVTGSNITGAVNQLYVCTIAGLTGHRELTLPSASAGDRVGIYIVDGDDTYSLIIKGAASQTINGGSAATEWSRLFIRGETVVFMSLGSNAWIVLYDGRIPMKSFMYLSTDMSAVEAAATFVLPTSHSGAWTASTNVGNVATVATGRFTARRACLASIGHSYLSFGSVTDQKYAGSAFNVNGGATYYGSNAPRNSYTGLLRAFQSSVDNFSMAAGDYVQYVARSEEGSKGVAAGVANSFFQFTENL